MRFAYADPPYLGCAVKHYGHQHEEAARYDTPEAHWELIQDLQNDYPDGWALSCTSGNLYTILPMCPADVRIGAWVKPFASFKPNVNPAYAWEPVIFSGGRKLGRDVDTVRDWVSANITMRKGVSGAKPHAFTAWILAFLGAEPEDEIIDLFPGSGAVGDYIKAWREGRTGIYQDSFWKTA